MTTCLKYCTPIAAAMFAGAMLWQLALPGGLVAGLSQPTAGVREGWLQEEADAPSAAAVDPAAEVAAAGGNR